MLASPMIEALPQRGSDSHESIGIADACGVTASGR